MFSGTLLRFIRKNASAKGSLPKAFFITAITTKGVRAILPVLLFTLFAPQGVGCYMCCQTVRILSDMPRTARCDSLLCKSDVAPDGRCEILFAFVPANVRSAYHRSQANRVGAPAMKQVPQSRDVLLYASRAGSVTDGWRSAPAAEPVPAGNRSGQIHWESGSHRRLRRGNPSREFLRR